MTTKSNAQGRAYEYAWIQTLYNALSPIRNTIIENNSSYSANERAWQAIDLFMQNTFIISAEAAVSTVLELEPLMTENADDELILKFQSDNKGIKGDVRDIVIKRNDISWKVGLSIKHNHEAVKHSRLSHHLDFGTEWYGLTCSKEYWSKVSPIFNRLQDEKKQGKKWSDIEDKATRIYVPLLEAFMKEIETAYLIDPDVPKKMVEYLIGTKDYYKIISRDTKRLTLIKTFNMHGTLNQPSSTRVSDIIVPILHLPTRIVAVGFKPQSTNTIEIYFDKGWQLSFRLHSASSKVEPSLKFDIQFVGMPPDVLCIQCLWHRLDDVKSL